MPKLFTYIFASLIVVISAVVTVFFLINLITLNLLPLRYLALIILTVSIFLIVSIALLVRYLLPPVLKIQKSQKTPKTRRTPQPHLKPLPILLALVIQIALTAFSLFALHYLSHANTFIDKITASSTTKPQNPQNSQNFTKDPFNLFIGGVDASNQLSDVNMILTVNPKTRQILITGIPRDCYVPFHNSKQKDKLTHSGAFMGANIENTMLTVADFMDIDLDYYFRVDFNSITTLVNTLGGITIYSDANFRSSVAPQCRFRTGQNHVNGTCALAFARERKNYRNGDLHRVENQTVVMEAIIHKLSNPKILSSHYEQLLADFGNIIKTNLPKNQLTDFIRFELDQTPNWQVEKYRLSGNHIFNVRSFYYQNRPVTMIEPDQNSIETARQKIKKLHSAR